MKEITEREALQKLSALCARSEHSSGEMTEKMRKWGIAEDVQARIMARLTVEKYVDDTRFSQFFINDKIKYNKWGRRKIEQALWQKGVDRSVYGPILDSIYEPILDDIPDEEYIAVLRPLIKSKWKTIKAITEYERSMKLIKFAMSRGFEYSIIKKCVDGAADLLEDD